MHLGHLLTRPRLTHPEVSLMVSSGFFCTFVCRCYVSSFIYYEAFCIYVATSFVCIPVFCPKLGQYFVILQYLCLFYKLSYRILQFFSLYLIAVAVILLAFLALKVQFLIRYNRAGRASEDLVCKILISVKGKSMYQYCTYPEVDYGNL